ARPAFPGRDAWRLAEPVPPPRRFRPHPHGAGGPRRIAARPGRRPDRPRPVRGERREKPARTALVLRPAALPRPGEGAARPDWAGRPPRPGATLSGRLPERRGPPVAEVGGAPARRRQAGEPLPAIAQGRRPAGARSAVPRPR